MNVKVVDAGSGVGGTWYWNRYPGADSGACYIYQYLFDEELYKGWSWSEKFPGQPEIEKWMNYVADKLDLKDIQFSTIVKSAEWDQQRSSWRVSTDSGQKIECQYLVSCTGMLSLENVFPGQDKFEGDIFHIRWPKESIDFPTAELQLGMGPRVSRLSKRLPRLKQLKFLFAHPMSTQ